MKKQIQFGLYRVYNANMAQYNQELRAQLEEVLNNGWELDSWKVVGTSTDQENNPVVNIAVCVTRELDEPAAKRGRPAKEDEVSA